MKVECRVQLTWVRLEAALQLSSIQKVVSSSGRVGGSLHRKGCARQPEGEVARQAKFFQPAQPTPNPIRDRSGRPDDMQDGRNTSRSQEINVNSFNEELSSSDRTGRLVGTDVSQTRSSEDSKSLNVEQTHDRTGRPAATLHTAEAQDSSRACSVHESDTLNVDDEILRKRMENPLLFMTRIMNQ